MWGFAGTPDAAEATERVLGARLAVPCLLELLARHGVRATWAIVGFLFYDRRDSLLAALPFIRPRYADPQMSPYAHMDRLGADEGSDPFHYGRGLIELIRRVPGQEIGTHTFSHYYCLEGVFDEAAFEADIAAATRAAEASGLSMRSIVFPRNQISAEAVAISSRKIVPPLASSKRPWRRSVAPVNAPRS